MEPAISESKDVYNIFELLEGSSIYRISKPSSENWLID